mgnify:CR=1 FL=1
MSIAYWEKTTMNKSNKIRKVAGLYEAQSRRSRLVVHDGKIQFKLDENEDGAGTCLYPVLNV